MKEETKITKEEHEVYVKNLWIGFALAFVFALALFSLMPEKMIEIILILTVCSLVFQIRLFGMVFRLRYNLLGPLTRYKKDSDESMELDEVP